MGNGTATPAANELPKTDVVIVGMGAAGGIAAYVLTQAGLKVVGIEAGPRLDVADFLAHDDELDGYTFGNAFGDPKANHEVPTWRRTPDAEVEVPSFAIKMMNAVGGTSIHYTANHYRFREDDFRIHSSTVEKYGEDALPAGSALADWPIGYDDLEPYYEKAEVLIGVSGQSGTNPFEAPRKSDYPLPPLRRSGYTELAHDAAESLGYHPFPLPAAIISEDYDGRSACTFCGYCTGFGCWNNSKSSTHLSAIPRAEATGNLEIRTNSRVMRILTDDQGRATGVEYRDEHGETQVQPAGVVIVATYTYENVRLLLLSASERFPDGLANSTGQVGRYYMAHTYPGATGIFPGMVFNQLSGTGSQATSIDDFNGDNFDHTGLGFIRGGVMAAGMAEASPIAMSRNVPPGMPTWGAEYKRWLHDNALSIGAIGVQLEVLPYEDNSMELDPEVTDPEGVPVIRLTFEIKENEHRASEYIMARAEEILKAMGAEQTWVTQADTLAINSHAYGGTRAGDDPATSVVDEYCLTHDVPNLAIMGASCFPNTTGYNPTQTVQAWAWRSAEYIAQHFDTLAV